MSASSPPPVPHRRSGWTALPVRCVRYPTCKGKVTEFAYQPDGSMRCARCTAVMYVIAVLRLRIAYVAETTAREMAWLNEQDLTAEQVLAHFGTAFPYRPAA
jgi:hypothetical protein